MINVSKCKQAFGYPSSPLESDSLREVSMARSQKGQVSDQKEKGHLYYSKS